MTKHCPNCGNEIDDNEMKCPECGFVFSENKENDKEEAATVTQEDSTHRSEDTSSHFEADDQNENIEWDDLKDLSIGHVMNLFNEQQEQKDESTETSINENSDEQNDTETTAAEDSQSEMENDDDSVDVVEGMPVEQAEETSSNGSSETDSEIDSESDTEQKSEDEPLASASLKDYIDAHKEEQKLAHDVADETAAEADATDKELDVADESGNDRVAKKEEADKPAENISKEDNKSEAEISSDAPVDEQENDSVAGAIPSKSKKPEEIEMDAAPIFFEEKDIMPSELGPKKKSQFATFDNVERPQANPSNSEKTEKKKNKKVPIFLTAAAVLALGAGGWFYVQSQGNQQKQEAKVDDSEKTLFDQTKTALNNYFSDDEHVYLKSDMVSASTEAIETDLEKLKDEEGYADLEKTLASIKEKQTRINEVNALYVSPVISGNTYKEAAIASDNKITLEKGTGTDGFSKLINEAIDHAEAQYDQLEKAKNAVEIIYKDGEARTLLSQQTYEAAVSEVNKVKNEDLKKTLTASLDSAKAVLAGETSESSAAVADATETGSQEVADQDTISNQDQVTADPTNAPAAETNTAVDPSAFTGPDSTGVYTSPVYTAIPEHVADTTNAAWVWAAGIKEKVIATCMERGYIVDGGYYLEPARIVNGQGYYNLYKTDGTYLVTINAQTGWFKGNASRNAGR